MGLTVRSPLRLAYEGESFLFGTNCLCKEQIFLKDSPALAFARPTLSSPVTNYCAPPMSVTERHPVFL